MKKRTLISFQKLKNSENAQSAVETARHQVFGTQGRMPSFQFYIIIKTRKQTAVATIKSHLYISVQVLCKLFAWVVTVNNNNWTVFCIVVLQWPVYKL